MNFAKQELMKYGWKEGQGLGKESTGIVAPVRPKLKFDNKGLGFDYGEEYSFKWWEHVYNNTAAKISVNSAEDGTKSLISTKFKKPTQITTRKEKSSKKINDKKKYNNFVKEEQFNDLKKNCRKRDNCQKMNGISSEKLDLSLISNSKIMRHGKFSGKLARLLSQENQFLLNKEKVKTICM